MNTAKSTEKRKKKKKDDESSLTLLSLPQFSKLKRKEKRKHSHSLSFVAFYWRAPKLSFFSSFCSIFFFSVNYTEQENKLSLN
jgi:hypothetical protein